MRHLKLCLMAFLLLLCGCKNKPANDWEAMDLNGKVKQIIEQQFLADVLKLRYGGTDRGNTNGMIEGLGMKYDTYRTLNEQHYAATAPDVLQHLSTSNCVMRYSDGKDAAVAYSGKDYRCLTMGFPFECIKDPTQRNAIMNGILNYLISK